MFHTSPDPTAGESRAGDTACVKQKHEQYDWILMNMKSKVETFHSQMRRFEEPIQIIMHGKLAFAQPIRTSWLVG